MLVQQTVTSLEVTQKEMEFVSLTASETEEGPARAARRLRGRRHDWALSDKLDRAAAML